MKKIIKYHLKNSKIVFNIIASAIFIYLKFAYFTSRWNFIIPEGFDEKKLDSEDGLFFAIWHNKLAYSMHIFGNYNNTFGLTSPHSDGKIIGKLALMMNHKIIEGSTNKNASFAVKEIIKQITNGGKIVVTPDGPRGPVYRNGSIITKIASKYNKKVIPVSCHASKYFELKSWDKMMLPKPFSKIVVVMDNPLELVGEDKYDRLLLEKKLNYLTYQAEDLIKSL
jgi:lysophospholipid acyltransferase (LPLAT)-like uncharacterized protein